MSNVTLLLEAADRGEPAAARALLPLVYDELRRLAGARLSNERPGQTLDATALVHEAYIRLVGGNDNNDAERPQWSGRAHFFGAAAEAMRRILIETARRKQSLKRGGDHQRLPLDPDQFLTPQPDEHLLALDEALQRLEAAHPAKARLVKLRYFAGLTQAQAAQALGVSTATADRQWAYAKAWLHHAIFHENAPSR